MATSGSFNFMRLKEEGCDPANVYVNYEHEVHTLEVHDARLLPQDTDILSPSSTGFTVVHHVSSITDWSNKELVTSTYYNEVFAVLKELTGAEHVFAAQAHISRPGECGPAHHVHNDVTRNLKEAYVCSLSGEEPDKSSWTGEEKDIMMFVTHGDADAQMKAVGLTAEQLATRRILMLNTWRNTSDEPVRRSPFAVADQRTIKSGDGCGGSLGRLGVTRREGQQFYWYPGMTKEELLVFLNYDSGAKEHAPCVHSAFEDANTPEDAPPRHSIELRCILVMPADPSEL
jgi:hypothetical protein